MQRDFNLAEVVSSLQRRTFFLFSAGSPRARHERKDEFNQGEHYARRHEGRRRTTRFSKVLQRRKSLAHSAARRFEGGKSLEGKGDHDGEAVYSLSLSVLLAGSNQLTSKTHSYGQYQRKLETPAVASAAHEVKFLLWQILLFPRAPSGPVSAITA